MTTLLPGQYTIVLPLLDVLPTGDPDYIVALRSYVVAAFGPSDQKIGNHAYTYGGLQGEQQW
jgi:hypothetical protein